MLRSWVLAALFFLIPPAIAGQALSVLHIKVALIDADGKATPVSRHALLISANPASAPPRRIVTSLDGTAAVRLRPGNYTVESDQPVAFRGQSYQWTETIEVAAVGDALLELTAGNAEVGPVSSETMTPAAAMETDPSFLLAQWRDSVVALWTPTGRASAFVVDGKGLVLTSQRVVGAATSVEVQLTSTLKVAAIVLEADRIRDVAVLWVDPAVVASIRPVPLDCTGPATPAVAAGQELWAIGAPLRGEKRMTSGTVSSVGRGLIRSEAFVSSGSAGGPVFSGEGAVVGITTIAGDTDETSRGGFRAVPIGGACGVLASAEQKLKGAAPPSGAHLPVEPVRPFPADALKDAAQRRAGNLNPYQMSTTDFDVAFITPVLTYGARYQSEQETGRERQRSAGAAEAGQAFVRPLMDFGTWSEYLSEFPPVLLVRVTPKMVEGFWTRVVRGAAWTQGVSLPSMKHFKTAFARMRAYCGESEVTPIHPFKLELRTSDSGTIYEGLYVFDPGALGPHCPTVRLVLFSEKQLEKGDTRVVDPKVLEQIWQDFAPYRALTIQ